MGPSLSAELVSIDTLKPHPRNARRGNVPMIADSLRRHGQYRPIVAHTATRHILAGTHTWMAAKELGWPDIAVTWFDGSEDAALRVLVADNRTGDLATYNDDALLDLLATLPTFDGTGFSSADVDALDEIDAGGFRPPREPSEPEPGVQVRIGPWRCRVEDDVFAAWQGSVEAKCANRSQANALIRARLGLPDPEKRPPKAKKAPRGPVEGPERRTTVAVETVPLSALSLFPGNAREGDIGAICESLRMNGQYRPVVANVRDRRILVGNHTAQAIQAMGWSEIAVVWVDVPDDEATRIVLVDNRTQDVATYDHDALLELLAGLSDLNGTGWTWEDLNELDASGRPGPSRVRSTPVNVGPYRSRVDTTVFDAWAQDLPPGDEQAAILTRLDIPLTAVIKEDE